ncbi:zinc dependent phospholipase C family protein [Shewanella sp. PP-He15 brown]
MPCSMLCQASIGYMQLDYCNNMVWLFFELVDIVAFQCRATHFIGRDSMPGAFAHLTAVNLASDSNALSSIDMPLDAKKAISLNKPYVELGCVSPDYPYLDIGDSAQNRWADKMHYERTGELIKSLAKQCKMLQDNDRDKVFAWLCGFISHVIADITIHPVVERKVGPYEQNKTAHRTCEMHQDAHIWRRLNLGEVGLADHVRQQFGYCVGQDGRLDKTIKTIWLAGLKDIHSSFASDVPPDFDKWHRGFQLIVDNAEEGYRFFPWARHLAANNGLLYPRPDEIDKQFTEHLDTPNGLLNYDQVFDLAVSNIKRYFAILASYIFGDGQLMAFVNWNLDNGQDENGELTGWV